VSEFWRAIGYAALCAWLAFVLFLLGLKGPRPGGRWDGPISGVIYSATLYLLAAGSAVYGVLLLIAAAL
jgi:hypothetical protein